MFLTGLALFSIGALGELIGHTYFEPIPRWEDMVLFDAMVAGVLVALFGAFVVGVLLPLTE